MAGFALSKPSLDLRNFFFCGKAAPAPILTLEDERPHLVGIISMYAPLDVCNVGETGISSNMVTNLSPAA